MADMSSTGSKHDAVPLENKFILVGEECLKNKPLQDSLRRFDQTVAYSTNGQEYDPKDEDVDYVFIVDSFDSDSYWQLRQRGARIIGPTVIIRCVQMKEPVPFNSRPLYCQAMSQLILCFTGFKQKEELSHLADLVHHMGGSIRKDFSTRVTHLVANTVGGDKYRTAVSLGTPIMSEEWIHKAWERRDDITAKAIDADMLDYRMKAFFGCSLAFIGFPEEEKKHMEEITEQNGGSVTNPEDPQCSHLVVDEHNVKQIPFATLNRLFFVKGEWFWGSVQMEACADEGMYEFQEEVNNQNRTPRRRTPQSSSRTRKRKRLLRDNLAHLANEADIESPLGGKNRRTSTDPLSHSASHLLDATTDESSVFDTPPVPEKQLSPVKLTARQQVVTELLQTETNYVGILHTILTVFRNGAERPSQPGGPLLSTTDVKHIFGQIPPIYEIHTQIKAELEEILQDWKEEASIGAVYLKHGEKLQRAYPPFINFFENTKETIQTCDRNNARFHAFLKACERKPECGRQPLVELIIRPVQRLPSVALLLRDILKRTNKGVEDHKLLQQAISTLEEVMTHINEDKRKTDAQVVMFDIVNDIDNCPPHLLSSHRTFINKVDAIEISDELSGKGNHVTLFLFSDTLELCKRRTRYMNNFKSPGPKTPQKAFKHIELMPLNCIKRVVDINETEEFRNMFSLICRSSTEYKERLYNFMLANDEDMSKAEFLTCLCKHVANNVCRADYENILTSVPADTLAIDASDVLTSSKPINKAVNRFGKRVSRVFSFNRTPRKLKRAMSSVSMFMSPSRDSSSQAHALSMTPSAELGLRLASSTLNLATKGPKGSLSKLSGYFKKRSQSHSVSCLHKNSDESPASSVPSTPNLPRHAPQFPQYATIGHSGIKKYGL